MFKKKVRKTVKISSFICLKNSTIFFFKITLLLGNASDQVFICHFICPLGIFNECLSETMSFFVTKIANNLFRTYSNVGKQALRLQKICKYFRFMY